MPVEDSPSLDLFKDGMPARLPDPSGRRRTVRVIIAVMVGLSLVLGLLTLNRNGAFATVTGTVYDDRGQPIVAEVAVVGTDVVGRSDRQGRFELRWVPSGPQILLVGYRRVGREYPLQLSSGQSYDLGELRFQPEDFQNGWSQLPPGAEDEAP